MSVSKDLYHTVLLYRVSIIKKLNVLVRYLGVLNKVSRIWQND